MECIVVKMRSMTEVGYGWRLSEWVDGRWQSIGIVSTGEEAERWVNQLN